WRLSLRWPDGYGPMRLNNVSHHLLNSGEAVVARILPVRPMASAAFLNTPLWPSLLPTTAWTSSCASPSVMRAPEAITGETKTSECLSLDASMFQHSPMRLPQPAPLRGQPIDTRTFSGTL